MFRLKMTDYIALYGTENDIYSQAQNFFNGDELKAGRGENEDIVSMLNTLAHSSPERGAVTSVGYSMGTGSGRTEFSITVDFLLPRSEKKYEFTRAVEEALKTLGISTMSCGIGMYSFHGNVLHYYHQGSQVEQKFKILKEKAKPYAEKIMEPFKNNSAIATWLNKQIGKDVVMGVKIEKTKLIVSYFPGVTTFPFLDSLKFLVDAGLGEYPKDTYIERTSNPFYIGTFTTTVSEEVGKKILENLSKQCAPLEESKAPIPT